MGRETCRKRGVGLKQLGYYFLKLWIKLALFCYYKKIKVAGMENIPKDKPVLFLSNHQNALMDVLLIATSVKKSPWFITRADVFRGKVLKSLFQFLQMIPIYRFRDGKSNLHKNMAIFHQCGELLQSNAAIVLFPEANHSLQRRVRPLSKGFTRIIANALEKDPDLDLQLVPIGQNYAYPTQVGDSATLRFGEPISVRECKGSLDLKQKVFENLTKLTTHIPEAEYDEIIQKMGEEGEHYLRPKETNATISQGVSHQMMPKKGNLVPKILRLLFLLWNLPLVFLWRIGLKPKVPEPEFMATFRLGFVLFTYSLFYAGLFMVLWTVYDTDMAFMAVLSHSVFNVVLVKMGIASSQ
ncbi:lysophospholipid acyltransferase family protein [Flagellimonas algicola]|uniref:Glycerol acyltransferase n=1 Tax=Flagellimonas algicola TaxID=2583815 RepID=A0ABY2WRV1_9FLAO|nr:lysophospholipid acyltransferase family protein [Allomuricauda algicola]TMU57234.1 glycerol acyltransferase [Allomuricauda algicola]